MAEVHKEAFRKYLDSAGVIDAMTKVLVALYEEQEKPKQAVDYIKEALGGPTPAQHDAVVAERDALRRDLEAARATIGELQAKVATLEAAGATPAAQ